MKKKMEKPKQMKKTMKKHTIVLWYVTYSISLFSNSKFINLFFTFIEIPCYQYAYRFAIIINYKYQKQCQIFNRTFKSLPFIGQKIEWVKIPILPQKSLVRYEYINDFLYFHINATLIISFIYLMGNNPALKDPNTKLLDIPTRFQWQNGHGFCGQTSIQSISLYYGSYISQNQVRKIAQSEVLVGQNAQQTLEKLSYTYEVWNSKHPRPQYKDFLQWIKKNIKKGYPVIITGYEPKGDNDEYDHIYLALGAHSENFDEYSDDDVLIYADHFEQQYSQTAFGKVWDTRSMSGNGKNLEFAIPRDLNYGIAVKGIVDIEEQFLPVRITLNEKSEPNVSLGQESVQLKYKVTAFDLTPGKRYAVLRYDSYKNIPQDHIYANQSTKVIQFQAQSTQHSFGDSVESSKMVFYRCIEEQDLE